MAEEISLSLRIFDLDTAGLSFDGSGCLQIHEDEDEQVHLCVEAHETMVTWRCKCCNTPTCQGDMGREDCCLSCERLPAFYRVMIQSLLESLNATIKNFGSLSNARNYENTGER